MVSPFRNDVFHDLEMPAPGFLPGLRERADRLGAVLILDDVRAGFRLHLGGAGELVGLQPDLTCYCKALGNGYPIAACLRRETLRDAARRGFLTRSAWDEAAPLAGA